MDSTERARVIASRLFVATQLIEHGALHREDPPIGIVRRVGAGEHVEGLLKITVVGKGAAIGREHGPVAGIGDGRLLQYGDRLRALPVCA